MPRTLHIADSNITGYNPSMPQPYPDGWVEVTEDQYNLARTTPRPMMVDGEIVSGPEQAPAPPAIGAISKLRLRRTLRDMGAEQLLDAFLVSDPTYAADWQDAQCLMPDDPFLVAAIPAFAAATGMSEGQISELLQSCVDA